MTPPHGGKRPGAGRPPLALPRQKITVRVSDQTMRTMERERKRRGLCLGRWIDWLIEPLS